MNNSKKNKFSVPYQYVWEACGRQAKEIGKMLHQSPKEIKENQKKHYRKCLYRKTNKTNYRKHTF